MASTKPKIFMKDGAQWIDRATSLEHIRRARGAHLDWPLPETLNDDALERVLFRLKTFRAIGVGDRTGPPFTGCL